MEAMPKLLLIEPHACTAQLISNMIRDHAKAPWDLKVASSTNEAQKAFGQEDFEVGLVDLFAPGADAAIDFNELKARWPQAAWVILQGSASSQLTARALNHGAVGSLCRGHLNRGLLLSYLEYARGLRPRPQNGYMPSEKMKSLQAAFQNVATHEGQVALVMAEIELQACACPGSLEDARVCLKSMAGPHCEVLFLEPRRVALVLGHDPRPQDVLILASRVNEGLRRLGGFLGLRQPLGASLGAVLGPSQGGDPLLMLGQATAAARMARMAGGSCLQFFDPQLNERVQNTLGFEVDLRLALRRRQLRLCYQPVLRASDHAISGAEALIRWDHPSLGFIPPAQLVPAAEAAGLGNELRDWVIDEAARSLSRMRAIGHHGFQISVNLTPRQLSDKSLGAVLDQAVAGRGLDPRSFSLEVSEAYGLGQAREAELSLKELRRRGHGLIVDNFDSGIVEPEALAQVPFDAVKTDPSMVRGVREGGSAISLVAALVGRARRAGLKVIAKGIEDPREERAFTAMGCNGLQGFRCGLPSSLAKVMSLMGAQRFDHAALAAA